MFTHARLYTHTHTHTHTHAQMEPAQEVDLCFDRTDLTPVHTRTHTHTHTHTHTRTHTHTHTYTHTYTHIHTHTRAHTRTHTHARTTDESPGTAVVGTEEKFGTSLAKESRKTFSRAMRVLCFALFLSLRLQSLFLVLFIPFILPGVDDIFDILVVSRQELLFDVFDVCDG